MVKHLVFGALAQQAWADVIISQELEEALLVQPPENVLRHAALAAFDLMRKISLVDLEEYRPDVTEYKGLKPVNLDVKDVSLISSAQLDALAKSVVQRQEVSSDY